MDGAADAELDLTTGEFVNDVLCIAQGPAYRQALCGFQ
jgi:hypothetical protein